MTARVIEDVLLPAITGHDVTDIEQLHGRMNRVAAIPTPKFLMISSEPAQDRGEMITVWNMIGNSLTLPTPAAGAFSK